MSRTRWPAACPRCGGDVVRIAYPEEKAKGRAPLRQFVCWRCQARLEPIPGSGGAFQIAAEVGIRPSSRGKLSTW